MKPNIPQSCSSISLTPQPTKRNVPKSRRSISSLNLDSSDRNPNDTLFNTLMSDPTKRAMILQMLSQERENIERYKQNQNRMVVKLKRMKNTERLLHCESPTALLRRRALEKNRRDSDTSSSTSDTKSTTALSVPFDRLLKGVVAYVEIRSKEGNRSAGAKALMQAMGAIVKDHFTSEVTHVVFKDGSFNTYQKAKLMKVHLVSVLWLEAVRKNNVRVPEKNYPALGTEGFDVNISQICQDYEKIVDEELRRSLAVGFPSNIFDGNIKGRKTALPTELKTVQESLKLPCLVPGARLSEVIVPTSQDREAESVISYGSGTLPFKRTIATVQEEDSERLGNSTPELTSDDDSDCGVINGHSFKRDSMLSDLDLDLIENKFDKDLNRAAINVADIAGSSGVNASTNTTTNTSSSRSVSLLSRKSLPCRKVGHDNVNVIDMNLTRNTNGSCDKENIKFKFKDCNSLSKQNKRDSCLLSDNSTNLLDEIPGTTTRQCGNRLNEKLNVDSSDLNRRSMRRKFDILAKPQTDKILKEPCVNLSKEGKKFRNSDDISSTISSDNDNSSIKSSNSLRRSTRSTSNLSGLKQTQKEVSVSTNDGSAQKTPLSSNNASEMKKRRISVCTSGETIEVQDNQNIHSLGSEEMPSLRISTSISSNDTSEQSRKRRSLRISGEAIEIPDSLGSEEMPSLRISTSMSSNDTSEQSRKRRSLRISGEAVVVPDSLKNQDLNSEEMPPLRISTSISSNDTLQHEKQSGQGRSLNNDKVTPSLKISGDGKENKKKGLKSDHSDVPTSSSNDAKNKAKKNNLKALECRTRRSGSLTGENTSSLRISVSDSNAVEKLKKKNDPKLLVDQDVSEDMSSLRISTDNSSEVANKGSNSLNGISKTHKVISIEENQNGKSEGEQTANTSDGNKNLGPSNETQTVSKPRTRGSTRASNNGSLSSSGSELAYDSSKSLNGSARSSRSRSKPETSDLKSTSVVSNRSRASLTSNKLISQDHSAVNSTVSSLGSPKNLPMTCQNETTIPNKKQKLEHKQEQNERDMVTKGENKIFRKLYNPYQSVDETLKNFEWVCNAETIESSTKTVTNTTVPKKTLRVPLVPISITPAANKLLENRGEKKPKVKKQKVAKKEKRPPKSTKKVCLDSSKDEQKALADEYVRKTSKRKLDLQEESPDKERVAQISRRRFQRLSQSERTRYKENLSRNDTGNENAIIPDLNRRSTLEFVQISSTRSQKKTKQNNRKKKSSIVCTRLHRPEVQTFMQIVKKLGCFFVEDEVSDQTTHLLVGEPKRTINLLKALARGCWIVKLEWLFRSLEAGKWLPEEDFELIEFSPAVQQCRMERQAFGSFYSMDIFANCGPIYIARGTIPRQSDLEGLVRLCKGTITDIAYNASIIVGDWVRYENVTCVTEMWILDSITFNKKKSFKNYFFKQDN